MKVKLLIDLKDAYNETYHSKGSIVEVTKRTLKTESDGMTVGHIKKYPYSCGWFYITKQHFRRIRK
jgi:hypothetical protein